ncbi:KilA-N domain-containing protein [Salmonella enterica subsp. enterica serovar Enteritidis]|nr:KilA-N domain-containing protein [Salmonella enterica subsp. enterica serovar Enteritidis]
MKEITLTFNNTTKTYVSDEENFFNLKPLCTDFGFNDNYEPAQWKRNAATREFLILQNRRIKTIRGKHGGTYVDEQTLYHYASWISPEFHAAVIEAFTHAVNGDGKKAVKKAQSVARVKSKEMIENLEVQFCTSKIQKKAVREFRR